eukprot:1473734-Rhodomonas_salina.1
MQHRPTACSYGTDSVCSYGSALVTGLRAAVTGSEAVTCFQSGGQRASAARGEPSRFSNTP